MGRGRLGTALATALADAGCAVSGPHARGECPPAAAIVLCVPDLLLPEAAASVAGLSPLVGHTSGATPLSALETARSQAFGLHPLQTFAGTDADRQRFAGCGCAVAGSSPDALAAAEAIAHALDMEPFAIADEQRAAYHAAASIASNFLVALEDAAESIAEGAGIDRERARRALAPLVRASVENWARLGPAKALTGPIARGDELTVARQRAAVERHAPELVPLFDVLAEHCRRIAGAQLLEAAQ